VLKVAYSLLIDKIKIAENKMINSYWGVPRTEATKWKVMQECGSGFKLWKN
jgi:hypothetical protein